MTLKSNEKDVNVYIKEQEISKEISKVYNSGKMNDALKMSAEFLKNYPHSFYAKAKYAVMHGDASYNTRLPNEVRDNYLKIAKTGTSELFNSPDFDNYPEKFKGYIRNEYYWFHEMHMEQYQLGLEELKQGISEGDYSATVGSSMLAYKNLLNKHFDESQKWAKISIQHFKSYEKKYPDWYNINYFSAQSMACLGEYDKALELFKKMYEKQGTISDEYEINEFMLKLSEIKNILTTSKK